MKKVIFAFASFFILQVVNAQQTQRCHTTEYMQQLFEADPQYKANHAALEESIQEWIENNSQQPEAADIIIPVVVHVVWRTGAENIPDAQVISQINKLSKDFQRLNSDTTKTPAHFKSIATDSKISFCLATRDPNGNWTNGIVRKETTKTSFSMDNGVKFNASGGSNAWDRNKYLNIWVCNLSGGILGYAQFPGGQANTDGVVIGYKYFGDKADGSFSLTYPYNEGRTTTHEVGHWFNLFHIWGDDGGACNGSDNVNDTPNQGDETFGCPSGNQVSCTNGPNGDNYQNYMDYSDDRCMNMFTSGQKTRMWATINTSRVSLKTSNGCQSTSIERYKLSNQLQIWPNPAKENINLQIQLPENTEIIFTLFNVLGEVVYQHTIKNALFVNHQISTEKVNSGIYFLEVSAKGQKATQKIVISK
ncbi:MAG: T9SS type A sorting domain-containing protein [Flavobacteriales bacterium]|nr:T9SS type A sorting domain-containing protein [Flavobacteriales bacterium]